MRDPRGGVDEGGAQRDATDERDEERGDRVATARRRGGGRGAEVADPRAHARIVKARPRGVVSDRTGCDASGVDDDGGGGGDAARGPPGEPRVIPQGSLKVVRASRGGSSSPGVTTKCRLMSSKTKRDLSTRLTPSRSRRSRPRRAARLRRRRGYGAGKHDPGGSQGPRPRARSRPRRSRGRTCRSRWRWTRRIGRRETRARERPVRGRREVRPPSRATTRTRAKTPARPRAHPVASRHGARTHRTPLRLFLAPARRNLGTPRTTLTIRDPRPSPPAGASSHPPPRTPGREHRAHPAPPPRAATSTATPSATRGARNRPTSRTSPPPRRSRRRGKEETPKTPRERERRPPRGLRTKPPSPRAEETS